MVYVFFIFTFLSCVLKAIFWLIYFASNRQDNASIIFFEVFNVETWGIKWFMMESAMILLDLMRSFLYFYFSSSPSVYSISFLTKLTRPFSSRMSITLYFHAQKSSTPSRFLSSLILVVILSGTSKITNKFSICEYYTLPERLLIQGWVLSKNL